MCRHLTLLCSAGLVLAAPVNGMVVLDQPFDATAPGAFSDFGDNFKADNFVLAQGTTADPVAFNIRFYNGNGGVPGVPLDSFIREYDLAVDAVPTGDVVAAPSGDSPMYSYTFTLPSMSLDPGKYWVGIGEADARTPKQDASQWLWARSTTSEGYAFGEPWQFSPGRNLALTLTGTPMTPIPEPVILLLLGSGLARLGAVRRLRTRSGGIEADNRASVENL
jgi:hypothetical protein